MSPRDPVDPSLVTNEPRKRKLSEKVRAQQAAPTSKKKAKVLTSTSSSSQQRPFTKTTGAPAAGTTVDERRSHSPLVVEVVDREAGGSPGNKAPRNANVIMVTAEEDDSEVGDYENGGTDTDAGEEVVDPETELANIMEGWSSRAYAFYQSKPSIAVHNGKRCVVFKCANPGCKNPEQRRYFGTRDQTSTSNLRKHAKICWGEEAFERIMNAKVKVDLETIRGQLKGGKKGVNERIDVMFARKGKEAVTFSNVPFTHEKQRVEIVRWLAESMRPTNIVEDRGFIILMKTGRPLHRLPSRFTVARDVHEVFKRTKDRIGKMLQEYDGRLSFGTDCWTSPNHRPCIAITVHFEHEGQPIALLLDIVELAKSHSGVNLANAFADVLNEFGVAEKILSVTCDNATANDKMIDALADIIVNFRGETDRTRCFAHILNLVVKIILRQFESPKKDKEASADVHTSSVDHKPEDSDDEESNEALEDDVQGLEDLENAMADEMNITAVKSIPVREVLLKLRKIALAIKNSPTIVYPRWKDIVNDIISKQDTSLSLTEKLTMRMIPRDVATRWNSTYDMLEFAYKYRSAINQLTADRATKLRAYELSSEEWDIVLQLSETLAIFKEATLFFSRDNPSLPSVIPAMDKINNHLKDCVESEEYSPSLQAAFSLGQDLLKKYYSLRDTSEVYRIAMVLHPKRKLSYFKKAGWSEEWIQTARKVVEDEFIRNYAYYRPSKSGKNLKKSNSKTSNMSTSTASIPQIKYSALSSHLGLQKNIFDSSDEDTDLSDDNIQENEALLAELTRYLNEKVEKVKDPLTWWIENKNTYPRLWRMARDYLNIPATSVAVERVFSKGRLLLSHVRNRLSSRSTRALLCLGAWSKLGYVNNNDLTAACNLPDVSAAEADPLWENDW